MVSYIYLTTNLINNKKYIGQHTGEIDDNYLGSGVCGWLPMNSCELAQVEKILAQYV